MLTCVVVTVIYIYMICVIPFGPVCLRVLLLLLLYIFDLLYSIWVWVLTCVDVTVVL